MYGGFREEQGDPSSADEGKFLKDDELHAWHRSMQVQYPQVFTADDKLFGEDSGGTQLGMGTKIMAWFQGDPNKPMRVEVRGSRWKIEYEYRSPVYIVKFKGGSVLTQIELTSAHEVGGWKVGWDLTLPVS